MALRYSTAARNFMAGVGSFKDAFQNGWLEIYSGAQPATADAAATGTLLCTISNASGALTKEVLATGTFTLTGGTAGSVDTVTVDSVDILGAAVSYDTSLTVTAAAVAAQINNFHSAQEYVASSSGAVITITALPGTGTSRNTLTVSGTTTTLTKTTANTSGGVASANGLKFGYAAAAIIAKLASQTWTGVNAASGTAGWYRFHGSVADANALDSTETFIREDGAIATSGQELNLSSVALTSGATTTISTWTRTLPTA